MMCTNVIVDRSFAHSYEWVALSEISGTPHSSYYFPGASQEGGRDGLLVEVRPGKGRPWLGVFGFGQLAATGISGIFTTPHKQKLCVVSRGEGYLVDAEDPPNWEPIRATPILDARSVQAQGIIVFAEYTRLVAYGERGLKWKTDRLAWDGFKIVEVTDSFIAGEFWDIQSESTSSFVVDLTTGSHRGGIEDPHSHNQS